MRQEREETLSGATEESNDTSNHRLAHCDWVGGIRLGDLASVLYYGWRVRESGPVTQGSDRILSYDEMQEQIDDPRVEWRPAEVEIRDIRIEIDLG